MQPVPSGPLSGLVEDTEVGDPLEVRKGQGRECVLEVLSDTCTSKDPEGKSVRLTLPSQGL